METTKERPEIPYKERPVHLLCHEAIHFGAKQPAIRRNWPSFCFLRSWRLQHRKSEVPSCVIARSSKKVTKDWWNKSKFESNYTVNQHKPTIINRLYVSRNFTWTPKIYECVNATNSSAPWQAWNIAPSVSRSSRPMCPGQQDIPELQSQQSWP